MIRMVWSVFFLCGIVAIGAGGGMKLVDDENK
jgi:hypothetical protein